MNYLFYKDNYHGEIINEDSFPSLLIKAQSYVDYVTMGKASKFMDGSFGLKIKYTICEVIDLYAQQLEQEKRLKNNPQALQGIKSETVKSHTVQYANTGNSAVSKIEASYNELRRQAVYKHLLPTGLLYGALKHGR